MVLYASFAPPPPGTTATYATDNNFIYHGVGGEVVPFNPPPQPPIIPEFIPAPIMMPADERFRNFPQIITFQVEVVRPPVAIDRGD